jgi:IS30 family transposase
LCPEFRPQARQGNGDTQLQNHLHQTETGSLSVARTATQLSEVFSSVLNNHEEEAMRTYRQLSLDERYQIQTRLGLKQDVSTIAKALARHPSTIYRELARNSAPIPPCHYALPNPTAKYVALPADRKTRRRRIAKGVAQRKIKGELQQLVEAKLRLSWSPEQICARLRTELSIRLSHETVYQHIMRDSKGLGFYRYCLRFAGYKQFRFKKSRMAEKTRARKNWIEQRPDEANQRVEIGHWERDSLLGKRGESALLTLIDRKSRYIRLVHVPRLESGAMATATANALKNLPVKTITNDNGFEFRRDESLQVTINAPVYFCNPSSPWERGSVENANGLLRQYFPKGHDFDSLPPWAPSAVENTLNFRPRKVLGYKTPHEIFHKTSIQLMKDPAMHFGLEFSCAT